MCGAADRENELYRFWGDQVGTLGLPEVVWVELRDGTSVEMPAQREFRPLPAGETGKFDGLTCTIYHSGGPV